MFKRVAGMFKRVAGVFKRVAGCVQENITGYVQESDVFKR